MDFSERISFAKTRNSEREQLITKYIPYIRAIVSSVCQTKDVDNLDEYSIALIAFNNAIDSYDESKGNFLSFAKTQIKWRIYDFWKKSKNENISIDDEDLNVKLLCSKFCVDNYNKLDRTENIKLEIADYTVQLKKFNIEFYELEKIKPKQISLKNKCRVLVNTILNSPEMRIYIMENMKLPAKNLADISKIPLKTIEKLRKYLLAIVIATSGDYEYIAEYAFYWKN